MEGNRKYALWVILIFMLSYFVGCSHQSAEPIIAKPVVVPYSSFSPNPKLDIDIYLDSTPSMQGFVAREAPTQGFISVIRGINTISTSISGTTGMISYYGFGTKSWALDQSQFNNAVTEEFYKSTKNNTETNLADVFEEVAKNYSSNRNGKGYLGIIISDLFGKDSNFTPVLDKIKPGYLEKGMAIGVFAIRSYFNGKVYDVDRFPEGKPYKSELGDVKSYRPFYIIIMGSSADVNHFYKELDTTALGGMTGQKYFELYSSNLLQSNAGFAEDSIKVMPVVEKQGKTTVKSNMEVYSSYINKYQNNIDYFFRVFSLSGNQQHMEKVTARVEFGILPNTRLDYYLKGGKNISSNSDGSLVKADVSFEKADKNGRFETYMQSFINKKDFTTVVKDGKLQCLLELNPYELESGWYRVKMNFSLRPEFITPVLPQDWNLKDATGDNFGTSTMYIYNFLDGIYAMADESSVELGDLYYYIKKV